LLLFTNIIVVFILAYMMNIKKMRILIAVAIVLLLSACATTVNVSEDLSPAELIQRGQEALERNNYNVAIQYYQALYDRNRNNIDLIITAEYHIANIHYKRGNYETAVEGLNHVLSYYNTLDAELLPQHFKRLSEIVLQSIEDRSR